MIKFGTDGWRGLIARDFTFENVRYVAKATAKLLQKKSAKKVVIGYDTRFLSNDFAAETAKVLAADGFEVYLSDKVCSTPQLSFQTKYLNADLGVVITASHNPPEYNGYKLKASFGGPATPEQIDELEIELKEVLAVKADIELKDIKEYIAEGTIVLFDAGKTFYEHIRKQIDLKAINDAGFKVLFDPMHGAGMGMLNGLLDSVDEIHGDYNPSFGEVDHPEPIGECMPVLMEKVKNGDYELGLATDGDADRLGTVDEDGTFVDSHRVYLILLKYLYENKGLRGDVVKTVSLTSMVDVYCSKNNIPLHETPVGFKYSAEKMAAGNVLIGGEESGGLGTLLHIPERDGIFNALLLMEAMAARKMSLKQMCEELDQEFGVHRYHRRDVKVTLQQKEDILNAAKKLPSKIGKYEVQSTNLKDGFKFIFDNGAWLLIRASGTEPLIRFYVEAGSVEMVNELLDEGLKLK